MLSPTLQNCHQHHIESKKVLLIRKWPTRGEIVFVSRRVITVTQHGACSEFRTVKIITKNGHLEPQQFSL